VSHDAWFARGNGLISDRFGNISDPVESTMQKECWKRWLPGAALVLIASSLLAQAGAAEEPPTKQVTLRNGITLHYAEQGGGEPVIFVHRSLGD
jgi:hypothetical protein